MTPAELFQACQLYVHGVVEWDADMEVVHSGLIPEHRSFKSKFSNTVPRPEVMVEVRKIVAHAERLFKDLYPFKSAQTRPSFRPMITGPEPLHFDTYAVPLDVPLLSAYVNISKVPRIYNVGPSLPELVSAHGDLLRRLLVKSKSNPDEMLYRLRELGVAGKGPLGIAAIKTRHSFAPGAIWFFNAKTVSHEVVYGEGTVGISWEVPGSTLTHREILQPLM